MKAFWCKQATSLNGDIKCTNFGDILTPYIMSKHDIPVNWVDKDDKPDLFGVGSILQDVPDNYSGKIWSSGFIFPTKRLKPKNPPLAVRGRLSLAQFDCDITKTVLGDGGLVLNRIFNPNPPKKYLLGVLPHYADIINMRDEPIENYPIFTNRDVLFIDPRNDVEKVVTDICSCQNVITSSLHGVITCDSCNISHALFSARETDMVIHKQQGSFKFKDYYSAFGLEFTGPAFRFHKNSLINECLWYCEEPSKPGIEEVKDQLIDTLYSI